MTKMIGNNLKVRFKRYLDAVMQRAAQLFDLQFDDKRASAVLGSAALKDPPVALEPFFLKTFGFNEGMFRDVSEGRSEKSETAKKLQANGTFKVDMARAPRVIDRVLNRLGLRRNMFKPVGPVESANTLPDDTSSGFPDFKQKSEVKNQAIAQAVNIITSGSYKYVSQLFISYVAWRTQERQGGTKFRQIYILPYLVNIFENMFMRPIINHYQELQSSINCAYSFHANYEEQKLIWLEAQKYSRTISIDYSGYDQSISGPMLILGMRIIKSLFILAPWQAVLFDELVVGQVHSYLVSCVEVDSSGQSRFEPLIVRKSRGLISGSVFTNFLGTVINLFMIEYYFDVHGYYPDNYLIKVKSDDTLIITNDSKLNVEHMTQEFNRLFGCVIDPVKSTETKPGEMIFYLGYYFDSTKRLASSTDLLLRKLVVSGRFISEDVMPPAVRILSKAVSVLSNVSNGYDLFFKYVWPNFSNHFEISELPEYYFDLTQNERQSFRTDRLRPVLQDLKFGWLTK